MQSLILYPKASPQSFKFVTSILNIPLFYEGSKQRYRFRSKASAGHFASDNLCENSKFVIRLINLLKKTLQGFKNLGEFVEMDYSP